MHTITKVFVILNLIACMILSQFVWISLSGDVQWRERFEWERDARHSDKNRLESAYNELAAAREANRNQTSQNDSSMASLLATQQALDAWRTEAKQSMEDAQKKADELVKSTEPFEDISNGYKDQVVEKLLSTLKDRSETKNTLFEDRATRMDKVATKHDQYAKAHEHYLTLEFQQFLLQEQHERRLDRKARYRWLRPDIQAELGENGPVIFANVDWAVGKSLQLNRGRRHGVELHQKYTIMRNGVTVAVVDVVEVQNTTCECLVVDLVNAKALPKAGDDAITRLFMSRVNRPLRGR